MKTLISFISLITLSFVCGFEGENVSATLKIVPLEKLSETRTEAFQVYDQMSKEISSLFVHHKTRGNEVLVECIVSGVSFRESDKLKEKVGKMIIWVDGKRNSEVGAAAFIIKGLSPGSHKLKLEVVSLNNQSYGLTKEFIVNIPK